MTSADRIDAIACLLWSPFVATCCLAIVVAVLYVARYDRRKR